MPELTNVGIYIINPRLLMDLGYEFNIYLVKSKSILNTFKIMPKLKIEAYQAVGMFDLICKHFQCGETLQTLLNRHKISWYGMQEWRVKQVDRYSFQSNFDYTHWSVVSDRSLQALNIAQTNWHKISAGMKKELIDNNYVFGNTLNPDKYRMGQLSRVFTFVSFPKAVGETAIKRNEELRRFLLPAYGNIVASLYWGDEGEPAQCAIECEGPDVWQILDLVTYELHRHFGEGITTETYLLRLPLFDQITVDLPKKWPKVKGKESGEGEGELEKYLKSIPEDYSEILSLLEHYGHDISFVQETPNVVLVVLFYQQCRDYINEIKNYDTHDCKPIQEVADRALADMLFGVLKAEGSYIARGAVLIGPKLELMFRRTLSAVAFSKLRDGELVKQALKADTVKKSFFPDSLKMDDILRMISLWNQNYPGEVFATEKMLDDWSKFRPIRNIGGHALSADLARVREDAPLGFGLITKLLKIRTQLPEEFKYKLE